MGWGDLVVLKWLENLMELIGGIDNSILEGLAIIALFIILIGFVFYFLIWQGIFDGYWLRTVIILGIWLLIELANLIGGGHPHS